MSVLNHKAKMIDGTEVDLNDYKGKLVIVVNTASRCKLTPQLRDLEYLHQKFKDRGLVILGFPCNQFANQENGELHEIEAVYRKEYGVTFPIFDRIEVNGDDAHPLFKELTAKARGPLGSKRVMWNFNKFLIAPDGKNVVRYAPTTNPRRMEAAIEKILGQQPPKADRTRPVAKPVLRPRRRSALPRL